MKIMRVVVLSFMVLLSRVAMADISSTLEQLQHDWAVAQYERNGDEQIKAYKALIIKAEQASSNYPDSAEILTWQGIITSSFAGVKGGLGALSLAYDAKSCFDKAIERDGSVLAGSAYTSLATLYSKVPGWPIAFGDDDKAKALFDKSLVHNPNGIDSNYFYAEFLFDNKHYPKAKEYLLKAQSAPARPERPLADKGRQQEIALLLQKINDKLDRK